MASVDFYALEGDLQKLIEFILGETDFRIFESYSRFDSELREFRTFEELAAAFTIGRNSNDRGLQILLKLWSPSAMERVSFERINLKVPGHTFRYRINGIGLIQFYLGGVFDERITNSSYGHWNQPLVRHRETGEADTVDWTTLNRLSGRVQRFIRNKMAVAKVGTRPILPEAFSAYQRGHSLNCIPIHYDPESPEIKILKHTSQ